jgi:two-component system, NarL family, sensor kinase
MEFDNFKILIFFLGICFIIFFLSGFIILLLYKHQNKYLMNLQNITKIQADHSFAVLNSKIEIQESTFNFISKEVHDNIGLQLTLAKRGLMNLSSDNSVANSDLHLVYELISNVIVDLGNLSRSLSTEFIIKNGLVSSIEREISIINRNQNLQVTFEIRGEEQYFESSKELIVFRLIQESINNAIKHSGSPNVHIGLTYTANAFEILIADFGKGFEFEQNSASHSGLSNMNNRVKILKGSLNITSTVGVGTRINIFIPN